MQAKREDGAAGVGVSDARSFTQHVLQCLLAGLLLATGEVGQHGRGHRNRDGRSSDEPLGAFLNG